MFTLLKGLQIIRRSIVDAIQFRTWSSRVRALLNHLKNQVDHMLKRRRFIRYGLLSLNIGLLVGIALFVVQSPPAVNTTTGIVNNAVASNVTTDPLDQLSSADIAVNLARMTSLPEATAVKNLADSVAAELAVPPANTTVIAKPQSVATDLKSRKDIVKYTVKAGETVASIAAQFGVTSESIMWSNNISGNVLNAGAELLIPPLNGLVYVVKSGDTPDSLAQKFRADKEKIIAFNDAELSGLREGEQILIPGGQQPAPPAPVYNAYSYAVGSFVATYGFNGYDYGFCTWYVANRRAQIGNPVPSNLGNASTWDDRAFAGGLSVNRSPAVGAAAVTSQYGAGHVVFVESVNGDGSIWVSEMNSHGQRSMTDPTPAGGWGRVDYKLIPASLAASYNYIH